MAPAVTRCETLIVWVVDFTVVMDTLRATDMVWDIMSRLLHGRSPDFAGRWFYVRLPGFPVA